METLDKPKILIVTPTAHHKDYCLREWAKSISELTYDNLDILILDNSEDKKHAENFLGYKFRPKTYIMHVPKIEKDKDIRYHMARCNEISRVYAIKNNYDYILSIESDVFAPVKNAVEILLSHNREVVGFTYFIGKHHNSMLVCLNRISENTYFKEDALGDWQSGLLFMDGTLKECVNLGLGFVLIKRSVFTQIPFQINDEEWHIETENFAHADTFFNIDLQKKGIPIYCDTNYICEHQNQSWGKVLESEKLKKEAIS